LAYTSTSLFIIERSQDRNSKKAGIWRQELVQRSWRGATCWLAAHNLLNLLFFFFKDLFMYMSTLYTPEEGSRSHYRWLWATMWLLGIELRTYLRENINC
jgi:hypothetical protein